MKIWHMPVQLTVQYKQDENIFATTALPSYNVLVPQSNRPASAYIFALTTRYLVLRFQTYAEVYHETLLI